MIEITHAQAQHLIRAGQDGRRLPDEQWAALQAHLERCFVCRAYRVRLAQTEHDLDHFLHERWHAVEMSAEAQSAALPWLLRRRRLTAAWRRIARKALPYVLGVLALLSFFIWQQAASIRRDRLAAVNITATPAPTRAIPTPTATPGGGPFTELLAFAELVDGAPDIILLNPAANRGAGERTNLTHHPARDIGPVWSPDGEWIAFLSDRQGSAAGGKFELYVISIAGTRLTRLTNRADIDWSGPLSWSADGKTIALTGWRDVTAMKSGGLPNDQSFVYLVPLDGSGPRKLAFTGGAPGALSFSPGANLLAYAAPNGEGITVYDLLNAQFNQVTYDESTNQGLETGAGGSFDWSPDGRRLVFTASQPTVRVNNAIKETLDLFSGPAYGSMNSTQNTLLYSEKQDRYITALSWLPERARRVVAFLLRDERENCTVLQLLQPGPESAQAEVPALCVQGSLAPQQWARNREGSNHWLVITARPRDDPQGEAAFYAVQVPRDLRPGSPIPFQRLANAEPLEGPAGVSAAVIRPRRLPDEAIASIDPRPAAPADPPASVTALPASLPGRIVFREVDSVSSRLWVLRPNGKDNRLISEINNHVACPAWSPDGQRLALLSDRASAIRGAMEVFIIDGAASEGSAETWTQLTDRMTSPEPLAEYACPVWSPDGTRLALVTRARSNYELVLLPTGEGQPVSYPLQNPSQITPPVWAPDGQSLLLISPGGYGSDTPLRIYALDLTGDTPRQRLLVERPDLSEILGMVFAPRALPAGGRARAAFVGMTATGGALKLFTMNSDGSQVTELDELPSPTFNGWFGTPGLAWLPDGSLFYPIRARADARYKTSLWLINSSGDRRPLAYLEDMLIDSAWSPDGRWLAYTSDAGLFLLDRQAEGRTVPVLLTDQRVNALDWK